MLVLMELVMVVLVVLLRIGLDGIGRFRCLGGSGGGRRGFERSLEARELAGVGRHREGAEQARRGPSVRFLVYLCCVLATRYEDTATNTR